VTGRILFITGTDTDVGKTIATAAIAAALIAQRPPAATGPVSVAVDKPVQTGVLPGEAGDVDVVRHLAGVRATTEGIRLRRPMAPVPAARHDGVALPTLDEHAARIRELAQHYERVLVEGAGGLLVQLDGAKRTIADLAARFSDIGSVVVVCRSGLGTLNHTELTLEALSRRGLPIAGVIIGSWPTDPDDIQLSNREHLCALGVPLLAALPEGSARLTPEAFRISAPSWFNRFP